MANLKEATQMMTDFLKKTLNVKDVKIVKVVKTGNGWQGTAEVYEESSFIKSLGLPTRVQDRNFYDVRLNDNMEIESYERKRQADIVE